MKPSAILVCFMVGLICAGGRAEVPADGTDFAKVCQWLTGSFSSNQQSIDDASYFDIRLHMSRVWVDRTDGYWLYVEQARADGFDQPYRQRVYQVVDNGNGEFESRVFELPGDDPLKYAGAWQDAAKLVGVTPETLKQKQGCSIYLKKAVGETLEGATRGKGCVSTRQGAAYTTSEVKLFANELHSWDRGWADDGKQAWGAVKGGYIFKRVEE